MVKQKSINHRRLLGIAGSYLVAFLLPFLSISWMWYLTATESTEQQVKLMAKNQMIQLDHSLDREFMRFVHLTERMSDNHQLSLSSLDHPYYAKEGKELLHTYKLTSDWIEEIYVYYHKDRPEVLYSSSGHYSLKLFLQKKAEDTIDTQKKLLNQLAVTDTTLVKMAPKDTASSFLYLYVVPIKSKEGALQSTVVYEIKNSNFVKLLDSYSDSDKNVVCLIDGSNRLVTKTKKEELNLFLGVPQSIEKLMKKDKMKIEQKDYFVQRLKNTHLDLVILSLINPASALLKIKRVQTNILVLFWLILCTGLGIVLLFSLRYLRPLQKIERLFQSLQKDSTISFSSLKDIYDSLENFFVKHQTLNRQNQLQAPYAREQVIHRLLNNQLVIDSEIEQLLTAVHISFSTNYFFIATMDLKPFADRKEQLKKQLIILLSMKSCVYGIENTGEQTFSLAIGCGTPTDQVEIVHSVFPTCLQPISLGVGSVVERLGDLHQSYMESLTALYYIREKQAICFFSDLSSRKKARTIEYPVDLRSSFMHCLEKGELTAALKTIEELISYGRVKLGSLSLQKLYGYHLLNTTIQIGRELIGESIFNGIEERADFSNLNQLETILKDLVRRICEKVRETSNKGTDCLEQQILAYLNQHFQSAQLCLESTAEVFEVSTSFVSRSIRKESGLTFSKYIQRLRFRQIKQELVETELPIKIIIQQNGYYDTSNFTRKFRQLVGMTPGKYREKNRR